MTNKDKLILIADDDVSIRESLSEILINDGYRVRAVANGEEAVLAVSEQEPDVILLDMFMPEKDGLEVTRILKSDPKFKHIPVIIVTGKKDLKSRIEALETGADDYLTKPPHHAELKARVNSLLKVKEYHDYLQMNKMILEFEVEKRTQQLKKTFDKLKNTSLETIYYLARAAEYRDEDTSMHIHRVSQYAALLAKTIGLKELAIETIMYSSPMHDIGKIGTPDKILLKPGKLDPEEWEIMKKHTLIGGDILEGSNSPYIQMGRTIAMTHHEKWDGSGYPKGLKNTEIPIEGRITAVADVFDALSSKRPYKEAFPEDTAFGILAEQKGRHFDPELVDAFLSIKKRISNIRKMLMDEKNSWKLIKDRFHLYTFVS